VTWLESIDEAPWLVEHVIAVEDEVHGNGLGDINGDGRMDIVTPLGWYECPEKAAQDEWTFHDDYRFHHIGQPESRNPASHPMLVADVNGDGLADIIAGSSHSYGLAWLEQKLDGDTRSFITHWAERDFGQFHTMALGDLDGDGKDDLVTGKRLFAHHGRDVSCYEPLFVFWYDMQGGKLNRHPLSFGHMEWIQGEPSHNPPPNGAIAMGMKTVVADMDGDGDNDVVSPGKSGLYVFYNTATAPQPRPGHRLPHEDTYPSWEQWHNQPQ